MKRVSCEDYCSLPTSIQSKYQTYRSLSSGGSSDLQPTLLQVVLTEIAKESRLNPMSLVPEPRRAFSFILVALKFRNGR